MIEVNGQRLEVRIPSGVNNGSKIRVAPGATQAGEEIHLVISVKPDKDFERKGDDLHVEVPVPLVDAVLGGEVEVMSLKGKLALTIPPETQNGKAFRLANQGMPHMNGTGKGDLVARVRIVLPTNLTEEQRELFKELRSLSQ